MKYVLIIVVFLQGCVAEKPIQITPFFPYNKLIDTTFSLGKELIYYDHFFLIANFKNSKKIELQLDSFVSVHAKKNQYSDKTDEIRFYFYKETSKTNLAAIKQNPREIDRYSNDHDLVYYYAVKLDGSRVREKIKNGEVVETTEKMPPKPKFKIILTEVDSSK